MRALDLARRAVTVLERREHAEGEERLTLALEALGYFALAGSELQPPATEQATMPLRIENTPTDPSFLDAIRRTVRRPTEGS